MLLSKRALTFLILTFTLSYAEEALTVWRGEGQNSLSGLLLMWTPGLVGIACALFFDRNLSSLALRRPAWRPLAAAYFLPLVAAWIVFALVVLTGAGAFEVNARVVEWQHGMRRFLFAVFVFAPTLGMILPFLSGLGEELGWRGFLHTELLPLPPARRYLTIGLIWSAWHWPLIVAGSYSSSPHPWISVGLFTVAVTSFAFFQGFLRDWSKSVFPAALAHGAHNLWFLGITPLFYRGGPWAPYLAGESGAFCAACYAALALWVFAAVHPRSTIRA